MTERLPLRLAVNGRFLLQDVTGVQRVGIEFTRALDRLLAHDASPTLDVELLVPASGDLVTELDLSAIRLRRAGRLRGHAWEQFDLPRLSWRSPLLCLGNTAPLARLAWRTNPTYSMIHDLSFRYFPAAYRRSFRVWYGVVMPIVLARAAAVFTVAETERDAICREYPHLSLASRIEAVQNGGGERSRMTVPPQEARRRSGLYVGSLSRRKGGAALVSIVTEMLRADRSLEFDIVGATQGNIAEVGVVLPPDVSSRVHLHGQINDPDAVERFYQSASVFVFPSLYEASPLPPVEAMSHGCPVVCSDIPSLRERCGDAAVYADPTCARQFASRALELVENQDHWRDRSRAGLARSGQFTWERQVRLILRRIGASACES
jgi:glycosyltransferase involved in cell wall biosynthesis